MLLKNWIRRLIPFFKGIFYSLKDMYAKTKKYLSDVNNKVHTTIRNVRSKIEEKTNFNAWKVAFGNKVIDYIFTMALFVAVVLFVTSQNKVLLAVGLFIGVEVSLVYLKQIKKVFD